MSSRTDGAHGSAGADLLGDVLVLLVGDLGADLVRDALALLARLVLPGFVAMLAELLRHGVALLIRNLPALWRRSG